MGERTVILVRHGQLDMDAFALDGFKAGLTPLGRRQARRTARRRRSIHVDAIHYSTIGRAAETASIIAPACHGVGCQPSRLLWELRSPAMLMAQGYPAEAAATQERFERTFARFIRGHNGRGHRTDLLITHGNLIRAVACRLLGLTAESWPLFWTSHCGITELRMTPDGGRILTYNDVAHLPGELHT
jgi:serine/threonine-protein phosphatase PGAM5